jgi:hypothetical protein
MRRLYDFKCPDGHVHEHFIDLETDVVPRCKDCDQLTKRVISPVRFDLEGLSGDFPTASDKWVKKREEKIALERKQNAP